MLYIFGSRARGDNNFWSDLDLFCDTITPEEIEAMKPWLANGNLYGYGGMIDLYAYGDGCLHSMNFMRAGIGPYNTTPLYWSVFEEADPITIEEVVEICREYQPIMNKHMRGVTSYIKRDGRKVKRIAPWTWVEEK